MTVPVATSEELEQLWRKLAEVLARIERIEAVLGLNK